MYACHYDSTGRVSGIFRVSNVKDMHGVRIAGQEPKDTAFIAKGPSDIWERCGDRDYLRSLRVKHRNPNGTVELEIARKPS